MNVGFYLRQQYILSTFSLVWVLDSSEHSVKAIKPRKYLDVFICLKSLCHLTQFLRNWQAFHDKSIHPSIHPSLHLFLFGLALWNSIKIWTVYSSLHTISKLFIPTSFVVYQLQQPVICFFLDRGWGFIIKLLLCRYHAWFEPQHWFL